jgi:flagellar motor switch protein FliM
MKKVTEEQLENLQKAVNAINEAQASIGRLEMKKQFLIKETETLVANLQEQQVKLENEYGNVTVNLSTGEITDADNS